ncbi:MAG: transcriptional regulator [Robiginitomaculum sp.]|nr:MAG: transcriptional regulator [Robiginitomaculum sp.]
MTTDTNWRSPCPISTSLEIFGDKWTLILLRDMFNGKTKYGEFLQSPERITTNILATRLATMTRHGIAQKQLYQSNPKRYEYILTDKGKGLHPILVSMCHWGNEHYPDTWIAPAHFMEKV